MVYGPRLDERAVQDSGRPVIKIRSFVSNLR